MKLRKNRYYLLSIGGRAYILKFIGIKLFGQYTFQCEGNDTLGLGINRLIMSSPELVKRSW